MATVLETVPVPSIPLADRADEPLYEIIDGQRVELPPMSAYATRISFRLARKVDDFAEAENLGEAVSEMLFRLPLERERNRRPDLAFVSRERWPLDQPMPYRDNAWDVVPDLAGEVISPHDLAEETQQKIVEYFQAGVRLVWVVYPQQQMVYVFTSLTAVQGLTRADVLDGGAVLPGFRLPLAELFRGPVTPA